MSKDITDMVKRCHSSRPSYTQLQAGLPEGYTSIKTLGDLIEINYKLVDAKEQMRQNLISRINANEQKYPGIIGFQDDVIPALDRAILSKQDIFLIGQIGQAKTKIAQIIADTLLSPIPVIYNSITNDTPMDLPAENLIALLNDKDIERRDPIFHLSPESCEKIRNEKLDTKIQWIPGSERFKYILATPDISVKDLLGYIDAIKVVKKGIEMYNIDSYSPGQIMQAKHGIFCIDELPVLDPRKQVALLSVLQEGRYTTGSYPVIFKPQIALIATANPIDYTHSGKVIEPLYDRLKSHIHTSYPSDIKDEMMIILQEAKIPKSLILSPLLSSLAKLVHATRKNLQINQERGVSVRLGIHGLEIIVGESERVRSLSNDILSVPRLSDMYCLKQVAKFELSEIDDTITNRNKVFHDIIDETIKETCIELVDDQGPQVLESIKQEFGEDTFQVSQKILWNDTQTSYKNQLEKFPNLKKLIESKSKAICDQQEDLIKISQKYGIKCDYITLDDPENSEIYALVTEMVLEGLRWVEPKILDRREAGYVCV